MMTQAPPPVSSLRAPPLDPLLQCPLCAGGRLRVDDDTASCIACRKTWAVRDGIPLLCRQQHDTYQADELSVAATAELIKDSLTEGWQQALDRALKTLKDWQAEYLERYVCSQGRSVLLELLDLTGDEVVLDHGCGWGNLSLHLAQRVRRVVAMDLVRHRANFTAIRAAQQGLENVLPVVSGDYERLPFRTGTFNTAIVNGVLEWVPCVLEGNPQAIQEKRLREVSRVLKPGGQLLLTIENRYWYQYFQGHPEVHTGIRWATLVPRWLANLLARRKGRPDFRVYTHSLRGYLDLFRRAGFGSVEPYVTLPEYNFPEIIVPAYDRVAMARALDMCVVGRRRRRLAHLTARVGLYPHVAYSFAFVCRKGPA